VKGVKVQALVDEYDQDTGRLQLTVASYDRVPCGFGVMRLRGKQAWVGISRWYKARTTGPRSGSAHLHGHFRQIAEFMGEYSLEAVKAYAKEDCPEWPRVDVTIGGKTRMVPISEADADTVAESALIEWCHFKASDMGIVLIEEGEANE